MLSPGQRDEWVEVESCEPVEAVGVAGGVARRSSVGKTDLELVRPETVLTRHEIYKIESTILIA